MLDLNTSLLIGGRSEPGGAEPEAILNPRTGETILDIPSASDAQVDAAVEAPRAPSTAGRARRRPSARPRSTASPTGSRPRRTRSPASRR